MIVTEDEAKNKRCQESYPAATSLSLDGSAYATAWEYPPPPLPGSGRAGQAIQTAPVYCMASACMAWRWLDPVKPDIPIFQHGESDADFAKRRDRVMAARPGYCGKAGKP